VPLPYRHGGWPPASWSGAGPVPPSPPSPPWQQGPVADQAARRPSSPPHDRLERPDPQPWNPC